MSRPAAALAVAVLLLLAACGGGTDDPPSSGGDTTAPARPEGPAPQPVVDGARLLDARTGQPWLPHGVNWSGFEYACAQGWGYSPLEGRGTDPAAAQAALLAATGIDAVRLPLNQDCWLGTRGAPAGIAADGAARTPEGYRAEVAAFVTALHARGMAVVLDLQSRKREGQQEFGNVAMPDADSLRFWSQVAAAYANDPSVLFDAFNEPYSRYDAAGRLIFELTWSCWRDGGCTPPVRDDREAPTNATYSAVGMAAVVAAIRDAGAQQPIVLGGLDYANDLRGWLEHRPDDDQLVAAVHAYDFKRCADESCWDAEWAPVAAQVPLLLGEVGATDPTAGDFVPRVLGWAADHGSGALLWVWSATDDPMSLTTGLDGTPSDYGREAAGWLRTGRWEG